MPDFQIVSEFQPTGDQPQAVDRIVAGIEKGMVHQSLMGVTGSGKTFTMANVIERVQRPTLVIAHNKTLAAQLATEFKEFFPDNAVEYFVSYYDYYQPEAYIPRTDLYIEKDADINEELDKLRHSATRALLTRRDTLIVASVSCIFGLGSPEEYQGFMAQVRRGEIRSPAMLSRQLIDMQYERNDYDLARGRFRRRGDTLEILPAYETIGVRIEFWGDEVERIVELDPLTGEILAERDQMEIYPAKHFVTSEERMLEAIRSIETEMDEQLAMLKREGKILEAQRLEQRTRYDVEMMQETGYCAGVENYSRHLSGREAGSTPYTLLDYFPEDSLLFIDESHMTLPQIRGMYNGDRARKKTLVEYGFRLPSALDNRPLDFNEFERFVNQAVYVSATPGPYEYEHSQQMVEQVIRPTGLTDPIIDVKPTEGQIDDLLYQIRARVDRGERCIVTTLTKRMAEELADYLREMGIRTHYLHSEIDTLERSEILRDLRLGVYDVIVGINLLREGLGSARSQPRRHPRRRQGGLSALHHVARSDHRTRGAPRRRARYNVRRQGYGLDEARDRRNGAPPRDTTHVQPRKRHHSAIHTEDDPRHHRARPRRSRDRGDLRGGFFRYAQGRHHAAHQGPGIADEDGGAVAGIRESRAAERPDYRFAEGSGRVVSDAMLRHILTAAIAPHVHPRPRVRQ